MALIRRAAEISDEGHRAAMLAPQPNHEYELQAALEGTFLRLGGARPGYGSIVGGGPNSTLLHYMRDRAAVKPGDVVVMDAATEYQGYAADVTRTIPVSGKYTPEQRAIYELVLAAQKAAERNSKPGMSARRGAGLVVGRAREGARAPRARRERRRGARLPLADQLHGQPALVQAGDVLDDPRHLARHRPRRARSRAVLRNGPPVQAGRCLHHRAGHLRQPRDARRTPRHAQEPGVHRQGRARRAALREHGRPHRGRLPHHGARASSASARCRARSTRSRRSWRSVHRACVP